MREAIIKARSGRSFMAISVRAGDASIGGSGAAAAPSLPIVRVLMQ
jgi:hypothetical protein